MQLGPAEIIVIAVIALLVFGPKRLPEIGRQVGGAMREVRKFQDGLKAEVSRIMDDDDPTPPTLPAADASTAADPPATPGDADITDRLDDPAVIEEPDHTEFPGYASESPDSDGTHDDRGFNGPRDSFI